MTETITQLQAADIVGVTPRRMRLLDNEASPPHRNADGSYPCDAFGQWLRARKELRTLVCEALRELANPTDDAKPSSNA